MKRKPLRKVSPKRAKQLKVYAALRQMLLTVHPVCHVCQERGSTDMHHMKGRTGDRLLDISFIMAVCRKCHRKIHDEPKWAYERGYLLKRI